MKEDMNDNSYHDVIWNPDKEPLNEFLNDIDFMFPEIKFMFPEKDNKGELVYRIIFR